MRNQNPENIISKKTGASHSATFLEFAQHKHSHPLTYSSPPRFTSLPIYQRPPHREINGTNRTNRNRIMSNSTSSTPTKNTTTPSPTITPLHDPSHQAKIIPAKPLGVSNRKCDGVLLCILVRWVIDGRKDGFECQTRNVVNMLCVW